MKLFAAVILACVAVTAHAAPNWRVIGGKDAPEGKYPYQVSLRTGSHFCGGSILNKRWILTAAHCVQGKNGNSVKVVAGTVLLKGGKEQNYQSEYVAWNKNFTMSNLSYDVGVVRVGRDIEFNDRVQPVRLPVTEETDKDNYPVVLTGWGSTKLWGPAPNNLQEIDLQVISQEECKKALNWPITESHICTLTKTGEGACHGDSGGPLVDANGVQVGIVSWGRPCAQGKPDVFARVSTFLGWIKNEQNKF